MKSVIIVILGVLMLQSVVNAQDNPTQVCGDELLKFQIGVYNTAERDYSGALYNEGYRLPNTHSNLIVNFLMLRPSTYHDTPYFTEDNPGNAFSFARDKYFQFCENTDCIVFCSQGHSGQYPCEQIDDSANFMTVQECRNYIPTCSESEACNNGMEGDCVYATEACDTCGTDESGALTGAVVDGDQNNNGVCDNVECKISTACNYEMEGDCVYATETCQYCADDGTVKGEDSDNDGTCDHHVLQPPSEGCSSGQLRGDYENKKESEMDALITGGLDISNCGTLTYAQPVD